MRSSFFKTTAMISVIAALLSTACGDRAPDIAIETPSQTLELVSTHDIDISSKTRIIAFSPNNVASWLGKVAMLSQDGALYVSGPDAQSLKLIGSDYRDVIGVRRDNAPALFITLSNSGSLDAYIESDDVGNFAPIRTITGPQLDIKAFCRGPHSPTTQLFALTQDDRIIAVPIEVTDNKQINFSTPKTIIPQMRPDSTDCAYGGGSYFSLSRTASALTLTHYTEGSSYSRAAGKLVVQEGSPSANLSYIAQTAEYGGLIAVNTGSIARLYNTDDLSLISDIEIADGLSISGLKSSAGLFSTQSSFGGSGYNSGIVAFPDTEAARIVFVSRSFLLERLSQLGVDNLADDQP